MSEAQRSVRAGRITITAAIACYGLLMIVTQAKRAFITHTLPRPDEYVFFNSPRIEFPDDFVRNSVAGCIALGLLLLALAVVTFMTTSTKAARPMAVLLLLLALAGLLMYNAGEVFGDEPFTLLAATPPVMAVVACAAVFLFAADLVKRRAIAD